MIDMQVVTVNDDLECYAIATAVADFLNSESSSGCACAAVREQLYAWLTGLPAPEPRPVTEAPCSACNVLYEAFQSTLTPDALLELAYQATQGHPLAIVLIDLLPTAISRRLQ